MNRKEQSACQLTQQIEKDYISNMLGITELSEDVADQHVMTPVIDQVVTAAEQEIESIDYNAPYKKTIFECRVFNIAGLNIAVAAENISETIEQQTIQNDGDAATAGFFAGTINTGDKIIDVVNLEYLVMNGVADPAETKRQENDPLDVVLLKGSTTGFIGKQLIDCQLISQQDVHWREKNSERLWLAGTVAHRGLALLDVEGIIKLLQRCINEDLNES